MKKIAIVVDNHKLDKFREGLKKLDMFSTEKPFTKGVTAMFVFCHQDRIDDIAKMCKTLEINFKNSN